MRVARAVAAALGCVALAVLGGCTADQPVGGASSEPEPFANQVQDAIAEAEAGGAGEAQLAMLRDAAAAGEVTLDQARDGIYAAIACFERSGLAATYELVTEPSGLQIPGYGVQAEVEGLTDEQVLQLIDACDEAESYWLHGLYQMQPTSHAVRDAHFRARLPALLDCLSEHGVEMDANDDIEAVLRASTRLMADTIEAAEPVDCLSEARV